jgi:hypothetical protein
MIAGNNSDTAVPLVVTTAQGRAVSIVRPRAKYPALRSSKCRQTRTNPADSARANASSNAAFLAPAQTTNSPTPALRQFFTTSTAAFHEFTALF